jgi:LAO/AO transport system kinase
MVEPRNLANDLRSGNRRALAQAITLVESTRSDHRELSSRLLEQLAPHVGNSIRIGITGVPGVGKSTLIEALGLHLIAAGHRVAVLSIDPSSAISGGSILGDKTRMELLARRTEAFIRPSPAGRTLGGVARRTREAIHLCEAAGFDVVIVETVGTGQSETAVAEMTDMFILLLLPGGGDDLQGMKRGVMELADLVLVNKADGSFLGAAQRTVADYRLALGLIQPRWRQWRTQVELCSALEGEGVARIWDLIRDYRKTLSDSGELDQLRAAQARTWMWNETSQNLLTALREHQDVHRRLPDLEEAVTAGRLSPSTAARQLLEIFLGGGKR